MWLRTKPYLRHLAKKIQKSWGRNTLGRITVRRRGGAAFKSKSKLVDYSGFVWNSPAVVRSLETNKTGSAYLALIVYSCGIASYILAPKGLRPGHIILNSDVNKPKLGYRMLLAHIPFNVKIHNVENHPRGGGAFARAAGNWAKILEKNSFSALIIFKNGHKKSLSLECAASIGVVSNLKHKKLTVKTTAGDSRKLGCRPWVRGVAQNAVDHPHGGGKGKKSPPAANYNFVRLLPKNRKTSSG